MAIFHGDEDINRLDWRLLQNGAINLYYRLSILEEDIAWLVDHGYLVHEFDCTTWTSQSDFHDAISAKLNFPSYYGQNIAAFNDCLSEIEIPDNGGSVLVFHRFDRFMTYEAEFANWVMDVIQHNSRVHSLCGSQTTGTGAIRRPTFGIKTGRCL